MKKLAPESVDRDDGCTLRGAGRRIVIPSCLSCPAKSGCRYDSGPAGSAARAELREWARARGVVELHFSSDRSAERVDLAVQVACHLDQGASVPQLTAELGISPRSVHRLAKLGRSHIQGGVHGTATG